MTPIRLNGVRVIGERINPTGKKRFQQALLENDLDISWMWVSSRRMPERTSWM